MEPARSNSVSEIRARFEQDKEDVSASSTTTEHAAAVAEFKDGLRNAYHQSVKEAPSAAAAEAATVSPRKMAVD